MEVEAMEKDTRWWGEEEPWSLRAKLVIRQDAEEGGVTVVTAEGGRDSGYSSTTVTSGSSTAPLGQSAVPPSCTVTLNAGPHHTLTLTCNPASLPSRPPNQSKREVASQTSNSLIPHLFQQMQMNSPLQGAKVKNEAKKGNTNVNKKCTNYMKGGLNEGKKNPRTVHIDVYCTESSDSEDEGLDSVSTPRTVYESNKAKVIHEKKGSGEVPHGLRRERRRELSGSEVMRTTGGSSGYPSRVSSSAWSGIPSEESVPSLAQTDSFDYENSTDRLRIKEKEKEWSAWQSSSEEEESSESSGPELAWSFAEADGGGLRRAETVRRSSPPPSLSDSDLIKQPPRMENRLPQTFGPIIPRANRHIGPTKNPNCPCHTCKFHFNNTLLNS